MIQDESTNASSKVFHIAYVSNATTMLDDKELSAIERISQINNHKFAITGILVYGDNRFLQFIEGPEFNIRKLMSLLCMDARHHSLDILRREFIPRRQFVNWHMRLTNLNEIQMHNGAIHDELFKKKINDKKITEYAIETQSLLLAFKHSNLDS